MTDQERAADIEEDVNINLYRLKDYTVRFHGPRQRKREQRNYRKLLTSLLVVALVMTGWLWAASRLP